MNSPARARSLPATASVCDLLAEPQVRVGDSRDGDDISGQHPRDFRDGQLRRFTLHRSDEGENALYRVRRLA